MLGQEIIAVEHIGSTAVEGLGAKPLIDMMIGVTELQIAEKWIEVLSEMDMSMFQKMQRIGVFRKENGERVLIICIFIFIIVMSGETIFYFVTF